MAIASGVLPECGFLRSTAIIFYISFVRWRVLLATRMHDLKTVWPSPLRHRPTVWNALPDKLRQSSSLPIFKKHLVAIIQYRPLTKLNGGLSRLHSADEDAVSWLTNYGK